MYSFGIMCLETITLMFLLILKKIVKSLQSRQLYFQQLAKQNIYVETFGYKMATNRFSDVMWAMQQILFMSVDKTP
mgnify:CR=1 FL=1